LADDEIVRGRGGDCHLTARLGGAIGDAMGVKRGGAFGLPMLDPLATTPAGPVDDQPVRPLAKAGSAKLVRQHSLGRPGE
jgi:hypothetical protein